MGNTGTVQQQTVEVKKEPQQTAKGKGKNGGRRSEDSADKKAVFLRLLRMLGFEQQGNVLFKFVGGYRLEVNSETEEISYPESDGLKVNERQTCNFSADENFVVFECVHRLLAKGYHPKHIELEPKWKVGHGASGGRADILVKNVLDKPLLIVECKTAGREFDRAWRKTLQNGDQLFSYAQQISETQFLCLYCSEWSESLRYQSYVVAHRDNEKYLAENPTLKRFSAANDVTERFAVWRDTYKLDYATKGVFEDNIQPYCVGKDKYSLSDLKTLSADDQQTKYHEFATVLRQHNVSGRENAFDKLVNLFLCKLVDETENPTDLKFNWKGVAYDTHFDLLDRLQQLYQAGMRKFLGEEITYINQVDVSNALRFVRRNPDATQRAVWNLFVQQKFFTNNDFSFIDVHNERLFYQNAEVLLKLLQMWQDIRLTDDSRHNQFLGDMFEGFLDQGIKQSEGQFFTPIPICRFMLSGLPLESLVENGRIPKAIDYACGAGHFLNELAIHIKSIGGLAKPLSDYHRSIFGIEKEYRLSKVAKVSAFMYGQQDINICYGDALVQQHDSFVDIQNGTFDLLVANPPYSVKGFLETLPERDRTNLTLTDTVDKLETNNSIEAFFVERAKQLLKSGAVASIILPSSFLSNGSATYVRARAILLQYFDIICIAEFGSGTFAKTGTNTVILFLRRKQTSPDTSTHYLDRVDEWFKGARNDKRQQVTYRDEVLIDAYAEHIGVSGDDYKSLLCGNPSETLLNTPLFKRYQAAFLKNSDTKNLLKQSAFKKRPEVEKAAELRRRLVAYLHSIERDKLHHFAIAFQQENEVVIVKAPTDTGGEKRFLGYEWSSAKGDEGIKLRRDAQGRHTTPLYDESNRNNADKLSFVIRSAFTEPLADIPEQLDEYLSSARLVNMLDFTDVKFDRVIRLSNGTVIATVPSKHSTAPMGDVVDVKIGGTPARAVHRYFEGTLPWVSIKEMDGQEIKDTKEKITAEAVENSNVKLVRAGTTLLSFKLSIGKTALAGCDLYTNEAIAALVPKDKAKLRDKYLFHLLNSRIIDLQQVGFKAFGKSLNSHFLRNQVHVPVPPLDVQDKLIAECDRIDRAAVSAQADLASGRLQIEKSLERFWSSRFRRTHVGDLAVNTQYGLNLKMNESGIGYKIFRMNEIEDGEMVDRGLMKYADITPEVFAEYRLNEGDILFNRTNSIEHVGKSGLFALKGDYCFASYLVRVVPNRKQVIPEFLVMIMNSSEFLHNARARAAKAINQANINAEVMKSLEVPLVSIREQQALLEQVLPIHKDIMKAESVLADATSRKCAAVKKYL